MENINPNIFPLNKQTDDEHIMKDDSKQQFTRTKRQSKVNNQSVHGKKNILMKKLQKITLSDDELRIVLRFCDFNTSYSKL